MGFLDGLAPALGAVGLGIGRGELLGTQQAERLRQAKAMQDYRQQLLLANLQRQQQTGQDQAQRLKQQRQAPYQRALANADLYAFFHDPRNRHVLDEYETRAGYRGIDPDSLPPDPNYNPLTGEVRVPGAETATPPPATGGTAPTPPPTLSLSGAIAGIGRTPTPELATPARLSGVGETPAPAPRGPGLTLPPTAGLGVPPQFALGAAQPRPETYGPPAPSDLINRQITQRVFAAAPAPPAATVTAAPSPPATAPETIAEPTYDPAALLARRRREGPQVGQTGKDYKQELAGYVRDAQLGIRQGLAGPQADLYRSGAARNTAQAGLIGLQTGAFPEKSAADLARTRAQTTLAGAQTEQIKALTPERVRQIRSTIAHQEGMEKIAAANAARAYAQYQEGARHNQATESEAKRRDDSMIDYRTQATERLRLLIENGDAFKISPQDKSALAEQSRIYFSMHPSLSGEFAYQFGDDMRRTALQSMNAILRKYKQAPISDPLAGGTPAAAPSAGATMGGPAPGAIGARTAPPTTQEKAALKRMMASPGGVHGWLQRATPEQAARVRYVYQTVTRKSL